MRRLLCLSALIVLAAGLSGCGLKGPLYLPRAKQAPAAAASAPTPASSAPALPADADDSGPR